MSYKLGFASRLLSQVMPPKALADKQEVGLYLNVRKLVEITGQFFCCRERT